MPAAESPSFDKSTSAVMVSLDNFSSEPVELSISRELQLQVIDCALPELAYLPVEKKLVVGEDYCRFVEARLTLVFKNWFVPESDYNTERGWTRNTVRLGGKIPFSGRNRGQQTPTPPPVLQPSLPSPPSSNPNPPPTVPPTPLPTSSPVLQLSPALPPSSSRPAPPTVPPTPLPASSSSSPVLQLPPALPPSSSRPPPPPTVSPRPLPTSSPVLQPLSQSSCPTLPPPPPPPIPSPPINTPSNRPVDPNQSNPSLSSSTTSLPIQPEPPIPLSSRPGLPRSSSTVSSSSGSIHSIESLPPSNTQKPQDSEKTDTNTPAVVNNEDIKYPKNIEEATRIFVQIVSFFSVAYAGFTDPSICDYVASNPGMPEGKILSILGIWLCLHSVAKPQPVPLTEPLSRYLALTQPLPPKIQWRNLDPSPEKPTFTFTKTLGEGLVNIANIKLARTRDMASHLYFDRATRILYLFMTPGVSNAANHPNRARSHIPTEVYREIARSFKLLFESGSGGRKIFQEFQKSIPSLKPLRPSMRERYYKIGEVWTLESFSNGFDVRQRGPNMPLGDYELRDFPYFGERLLVLERFLAEAKPSTLRQLMRDSRDQLQYYTFVVAIIVFGMTVLGLVLSILQTFASFWQIKLALQSA